MPRRSPPSKHRSVTRRKAVALPSEEELRRESEECARGAEAARYLTHKHLINQQDPELRRGYAAIDLRLALIFEWERKFRKEGAALAAWDAYTFCRRENWPIPEWVLGYLDGTAARLMSGNPGKNTAQHVAKALGLHSPSGRGNPFTRYLTMMQKYRVVREVLAMKRADPTEDDTQIFLAVAEKWEKKGKAIHPDTVRNWYYDLKDKLTPKPARK